MKKDFSALDGSILRALTERPLALTDIFNVPLIRDEALDVVRLRAGASRSTSAESTIQERLQILRRDRHVTYDKATGRWSAIAQELK